MSLSSLQSILGSDVIFGNGSKVATAVEQLLQDIEQPKYIAQNIRNKQGNFKGCLVATKVDDKVQIGWSLCNRYDTFNKKIARQLAYDRATTVGRDRFLPNSIENDIPEFVLRASRYFKVDASTILCDTHAPKDGTDEFLDELRQLPNRNLA